MFECKGWEGLDNYLIRVIAVEGEVHTVWKALGCVVKDDNARRRTAIRACVLLGKEYSFSSHPYVPGRFVEFKKDQIVVY